MTEPSVSAPIYVEHRIDDIEVYRLSCTNGAACYNKKGMIVLGDMNYDDKINAEDITLLRKLLLRGGEATLGDANNDDYIDIRDLVRLKKNTSKQG